MPTIAPDSLEQFAAALLQAGGANSEEARITAIGLVDANLCGYDSHGVMRIPYYVAAMQKGEVLSSASWDVLRESDHHIAVDANWGFGHVTALRLTEKLIEKAQAGGVGIGTMLHSGHIGRLGQYAEIVAARGLVSMLMVNSHGAVHRVAPPGGKASRLATNPLCIGVPHGDHDDLILDFSTSATAEGKVRVKWIAKEAAPEGWLIDAEGRPTTDAAALYGEPRGSILPFGGPQMYKGFGLGLMVDILCGALSGGLVSREKPLTPIGNCVFMMVLDPAHFGGAQHFADEVSQLAAFVRDCPRCEGVNEIMLPGDPERRTRRERSAIGIPLDEENWKKLVELAVRFGVALP
jgi:uncharacterized oxidoreductase